MTGKPSIKPSNPSFSCGPCAKHKGWSLAALSSQSVGRNHRSKLCKTRIKKLLDDSHALLGLPADYRISIIGGSNTGALEAALWNLLGTRPVDVFASEAFGLEWITDCKEQLRPLQTNAFVTDYGTLPDLAQSKADHDIVFTWNGTSGGVIVPDGDWIKDNRQGLTICDATSAALGVALPWDKLDVTTFSWQKILGGEAGHGMLILSPRAMARLNSYTPPWPIPKLYRLTKNGKVIEAMFDGDTINTISLLCVEDCLSALAWAQEIGGRDAMFARVQKNFSALKSWVDKTPWVDFLAQDARVRSPLSVCLKITDTKFTALDAVAQKAFCQKMTNLLDDEGAAYDINAYRDAPAGLRIWCGATVETANITDLTPWLDWAFHKCLAEI